MDKFPLNKSFATAVRNIFLTKFSDWFVSHHTPKISEESLLLVHILSRTTTELQCFERSVFRRGFSPQNDCNFELSLKNEIHVPI